jgi:nucleotide-binding universal stress UspA family protein
LLNIKRILLPLDLEQPNLPVAVVHEAATLTRHFHSEIFVLHVVEPLTFLAGSETAHELLEQAVAKEQENLSKCLGPVLDGKLFKRIVVKGNPAREILRIAREENIDLIVMSTHGYGAFERFMLGSVTAKVLHQSTCPVWTGAHVKDVPVGQFAIRNVLCAVDFGPLSTKAISWAHEAAAEFGAKLTLAHVMPSMEIYGPGGYHALAEMKNELVNSAKAQMAHIQQEMGIQAGVFIGSGNVAKVVGQAAKETKADVIVVGARSLAGRFGDIGYAIIRESPVPVVSI